MLTSTGTNRTMSTSVIIDHVHCLVNCANGYVQVQTTFTHSSQVHIIYAGMAIYWFFWLWWTFCCRQEHACAATCQSKGICRIETTPQSVEATFTGRHETFQYTKVSGTLIQLYHGSLTLTLVHARSVSFKLPLWTTSHLHFSLETSYMCYLDTRLGFNALRKSCP